MLRYVARASAAVAVLALLANPAIALTDSEVREKIRIFARSGDMAGWATVNRSELTPEFLDAARRLSLEAAQRGEFPIARAAKLLVSFGLMANGDRRGGLDAYVDALDIELQPADSITAYQAVRNEAKTAIKRANSLPADDIAFHAHVIAADASYWASTIKDLELSIRRTWENNALVDLADAFKTVRRQSNPILVERLISLSVAVIQEALSTFAFGGDEKRKVAHLKQLVGPIERLVSPDFSYTRFPGKSWRDSTGAASVLADLSYAYGSAAIGAARLKFGAGTAEQRGDVPHWADLTFQLYGAETARPGSAAQLIELRRSLRAASHTLRAAYSSRAGRLWAASSADLLYAQLLRDEFTSGAMKSGQAFEHIEALKARLLLDQLKRRYAPLATEASLATSDDLERRLLSFPECKRESGDIMKREMTLASRATIGGAISSGDEVGIVEQIEQLYRGANAGFDGISIPASIVDIQTALSAEEAIIEYFIPFHRSHPAMDLWVLVIVKDRTALIPIPLEPALGRGSGFVGRMSIDGCPALDASPLTDAVAVFRTSLQSSDEVASLRYLRGFHQLFIQPIIDAGFDPEKFRQWVVIPHGPLHYIPFAALIDGQNRFLIQNTAVSISPSSSVWLHQQLTKREQPKTVVGLFAPALQTPGLPALPSAAREIDAILARFPTSKEFLFSGTGANLQRLKDLALQADFLHLSSHGDFPERNSIDFHAILLSGDGADHRLKPRDVRSLDLSNTSLVVLAVCNGGLYSVGPSDEPYGLMPAFLLAGATNVMGTLWPLEDDFGRRFVRRFYDHTSNSGPAAALRQTMLNFIEEGELVRRWSGFVVVGPGRPFVR
jgi:CHAT domain-containing protein